MNLAVEHYKNLATRWPTEGRHILAQYDADSIVVYQAYRPSIGRYAAEHGHFGGSEFGYSRMSWIKPNFLWMMYRCGWGAKENQEIVLAIRIARKAFDEILRQAVPSTFVADLYKDKAYWRKCLQESCVRLQWDPDHDPHGENLSRRAIQLGLRGDVLKSYSNSWVISIEDISDFVHAQHIAMKEQGYDALIVPKEAVYPVEDLLVRRRLGMDHE